jgi:hypothetical protein
MNTPVQSFKHGLSQAVTITGGTRAVAGGAVALDSRKIPAGAPGIHNRQIQEDPALPTCGWTLRGEYGDPV